MTPPLIARELEMQSLLEHVRKQRSVLVLGGGGIGKSVLLEPFELEQATRV
jgi:ABC-type transporter Mla maintaining outer membrane lipid asymmetry ATPase subunit MlaF